MSVVVLDANNVRLDEASENRRVQGVSGCTHTPLPHTHRPQNTPEEENHACLEQGFKGHSTKLLAKKLNQILCLFWEGSGGGVLDWVPGTGISNKVVGPPCGTVCPKHLLFFKFEPDFQANHHPRPLLPR